MCGSKDKDSNSKSGWMFDLYVSESCEISVVSLSVVGLCDGQQASTQVLGRILHSIVPLCVRTVTFWGSGEAWPRVSLRGRVGDSVIDATWAPVGIAEILLGIEDGCICRSRHNVYRTGWAERYSIVGVVEQTLVCFEWSAYLTMRRTSTQLEFRATGAIAGLDVLLGVGSTVYGAGCAGGCGDFITWDAGGEFVGCGLGGSLASIRRRLGVLEGCCGGSYVE